MEKSKWYDLELFEDIKTPFDIKRYHLKHYPDSYFFEPKTMKFFGDTMKNFGIFTDDEGYKYLYRKKPVKHGLTGTWLLTVNGQLKKIR